MPSSSGVGAHDKGVTDLAPELEPDQIDASYTRNPFVNSAGGNYALAAAEDAGTNILTLLGVADNNTFDVDFTGATRTTWSRGALEYGSEGGGGAGSLSGSGVGSMVGGGSGNMSAN